MLVGFASYHPLFLLLGGAAKLPLAQELVGIRAQAPPCTVSSWPRDWWGKGHVTQVGPITMEPGFGIGATRDRALSLGLGARRAGNYWIPVGKLEDSTHIRSFIPGHERTRGRDFAERKMYDCMKSTCSQLPRSWTRDQAVGGLFQKHSVLAPLSVPRVWLSSVLFVEGRKGDPFLRFFTPNI